MDKMHPVVIAYGQNAPSWDPIKLYKTIENELFVWMNNTYQTAFKIKSQDSLSGSWNLGNHSVIADNDELWNAGFFNVL